MGLPPTEEGHAEEIQPEGFQDFELSFETEEDVTVVSIQEERGEIEAEVHDGVSSLQPGILAPVENPPMAAITIHHMARRETATWISSPEDDIKALHEDCSEVWHERYRVQSTRVDAADDLLLKHLDPTRYHQSSVMISPVQLIRFAPIVQHLEEAPRLENEIITRALNVLEGEIARVTIDNKKLTVDLVELVNHKWNSSLQLRYIDQDCMWNTPVTLYEVTRNYNSAVSAYDFIPPRQEDPK